MTAASTGAPAASPWIRQTHRWLSIAFTAAVIANVVAMAMQSQAVWVGLAALVPLILLMLSGLYLFALPYLVRRRRARGAAGAPGRTNPDPG